MSQNRELIAERAYEIWEAAGRPEGLDLEHWLAAEAELGNQIPAPIDAGAAAVVSSAPGPTGVADEEKRDSADATLGASPEPDLVTGPATRQAPAARQKKGRRGG